jgi:hypothetical protein
VGAAVLKRPGAEQAAGKLGDSGGIQENYPSVAKEGAEKGQLLPEKCLELSLRG